MAFDERPPTAANSRPDRQISSTPVIAAKKPRLHNALGGEESAEVHVEWGNSVTNGTGNGLNAGWAISRVAGRTSKPTLHSVIVGHAPLATTAERGADGSSSQPVTFAGERTGSAVSGGEEIGEVLTPTQNSQHGAAAEQLHADCIQLAEVAPFSVGGNTSGIGWSHERTRT